ncbi:MAG TPA: hypothetical protein VE174_05325 [Actinomycetota bacterium]|nr:hypothetical protein [Actinomycetota bacterium]
MSTLPAEVSEERHRLGRTVRRLSIAVMALFVLIGATGYLGVKTSTTAFSSSSDYFLTVDYGWISRPGLNTPLRIHLSNVDKFQGPVTIGITQAYMSLFDLNGMYPNPSAMTVDDGTLIMEFDEPLGEKFTFTLDARLGPSVQQGKRATVSVIENGIELDSVDISTLVIP